MKRSTIFTLLAAVALASAIAVEAQQNRTVVIYTNGSGSATESDRGQAMDEATQTAQNWANSTCTGTVINTNTVSSNCFKTGSEDSNNVAYSCMVTVKARCEIEYRGR